MPRTVRDNSKKKDSVSRVLSSSIRSRSSSITRNPSLIQTLSTSTQEQPLTTLTHYSNSSSSRHNQTFSITANNPTTSSSSLLQTQIDDSTRPNLNQIEQSSSDSDESDLEIASSHKKQILAIKENFTINGSSAICKQCEEKVAYHDYSTNNLRTHLFYKHDAAFEILTPGQRKRVEFNNKIKQKPTSLSKQEIKTLNESIYECIIRDSRSFSDFRKAGMIKLLEHFKPGYKPPGRHSVAKYLKKK